MKSIRAASRCDAVPDAREVKPIDVGRPSNLRVLLLLALRDLEKRALVAGQHDVAERCWVLFRDTRTVTTESYRQCQKDAV